MVDEVLALRGERVFLDELPVLERDVVADDLDVLRFADAQPLLVRDADERQVHRIETLHLRRDGVDGDLIGAGEQDVLLVRTHGSWPGAVTGKGAVHHREEPGVDVLLDLQEIDQRLVDHGVGVMATIVEQTAEGVLHRPGDRGEDVGLDRRQLDDVAVVEELGHLHPLGEDAIQHQEGLARGEGDPLDVRLIEMDVRHAVAIDDVLVLVVALADPGIDHDRAVVGPDQVAVAVGLQGADDPLELPRRRRAGGIPRLP